jgi:hypothetical protein
MSDIKRGSGSLPPLLVQAPFQSGRYYLVPQSAASGSSATLGVSVAKAVPFTVPNSCVISRIGADISVIGDAGSLYRLGIYADDGTGRPGALKVDGGTVLGDSATVQEVTVNVALSPGLYWAVGVVQNVATTQPTVRTASTNIMLPLDAGTTIPGAAASNLGFQSTGVAGALAATFNVTGFAGNVVPRLFVKVA